MRGSFYTLPTGLNTLVNGTVFQAHYCKGITFLNDFTTTDNKESSSTVQYSHEYSSDHIVFMLILQVMVLGKLLLILPLHVGFLQMYVVFRALLHIQQKHVQCLRGLLWRYC